MSLINQGESQFGVNFSNSNLQKQMIDAYPGFAQKLSAIISKINLPKDIDSNEWVSVWVSVKSLCNNPKRTKAEYDSSLQQADTSERTKLLIRATLSFFDSLDRIPDTTLQLGLLELSLRGIAEKIPANKFSHSSLEITPLEMQLLLLNHLLLQDTKDYLDKIK